MKIGNSRSDLVSRITWGTTLTAVTTASTLMLACATPFAALAALAALFLPRRDAFLLIGANFLVNQAIGFGQLHYPLTLSCFLGGLNLALACLAATGISIVVSRTLRTASSTLAAVATLVAAFGAYEGMLFVAGFVRYASDFHLHVVLYILYINGFAFAGLLILQGIAAGIGLAVPRSIVATRVPAAV